MDNQATQTQQIEDLKPVRYRFLEPHEYPRLEEIFRKFNAKVPSPELSRIIVAETEDKEIVGFYVAQMRVHAEPIWIRDDYRESDMWTHLVEAIEPSTRAQGAFVIADNPKTEFMCSQIGLKKIDSPVYYMPSEEERLTNMDSKEVS